MCELRREDLWVEETRHDGGRGPEKGEVADSTEEGETVWRLVPSWISSLQSGEEKLGDEIYSGGPQLEGLHVESELEE